MYQFNKDFFNDFKDRMTRVFEEMYPNPIVGVQVPVDAYEQSGVLTFEFELPGISKEDVTVQIKDQILMVSGEKKRPSAVEGSVLKNERVYGKFYRQFRLPDNINPDSCKAKFENGILLITLEQHPDSQAKTIQID